MHVRLHPFPLLTTLLGIALLTGLTGESRAAGAKLKAGFVYVGPVGDFGWTHAHDDGRKAAEKALPWLETNFVESVPEGEAESYLDQMVQQGDQVVFTTSFGYADSTLAAAQRESGTIFANAVGEKHAPNMAAYNCMDYQIYYLTGLMAGALTKSHKVGYMGAYPLSSLKVGANAFAMALREVDPQATLHVRWTNAWYNPPAAKEATEALIADGADVMTFEEDSPTVVQVAAQHKLPVFGQRSPMYDIAPDYLVSGLIVHWEKFYIDFLTKVHSGEYTAKNLQKVNFVGVLGNGSVELSAKPGMLINPRFVEPLKARMVDHPTFGRISAYDLVLKRLAQMSKPQAEFDPYEGLIRDRKNVVRVPEHQRLDQYALDHIQWAAPGVVGPWAGEP